MFGENSNRAPRLIACMGLLKSAVELKITRTQIAILQVFPVRPRIAKGCMSRRRCAPMVVKSEADIAKSPISENAAAMQSVRLGMRKLKRSIRCGGGGSMRHPDRGPNRAILGTTAIRIFGRSYSHLKNGRDVRAGDISENHPTAPEIARRP